MLWSGPRVSGIVDWVNAGFGSPAADLARCRTNLAVLTDQGDADEVLAGYRHRSGATWTTNGGGTWPISGVPPPWPSRG